MLRKNFLITKLSKKIFVGDWSFYTKWVFSESYFRRAISTDKQIRCYIFSLLERGGSRNCNSFNVTSVISESVCWPRPWYELSRIWCQTCSGFMLSIKLKNLPLLCEEAVINKLLRYQTKFNSPNPTGNECQHVLFVLRQKNVLLIETRIQLECFLISF